MALSLRSVSYSFAIRSIVDYFEADNEAQPIVHTFENIKQARHYRFLFYGYKKALHSEGHPSAATADCVLVQIPDDWKVNTVARVKFSMRDNQDADKALEATVMEAIETARQRKGISEPLATIALAPPHEPTHDEVLDNFLKK